MLNYYEIICDFHFEILRETVAVATGMKEKYYESISRSIRNENLMRKDPTMSERGMIIKTVERKNFQPYITNSSYKNILNFGMKNKRL